VRVIRLRVAIALVACASAAAPTRAQPPTPPVFGARVETVYVDAFVTRDGLAVRGLAASDFELKDDGVVQQVELVASDQLPLLAVLAFDASSSVAGAKLAALQAAGEAFLDGLKPMDEAALITFNEEVRWASEPTADKQRVKVALAGVEPRGGTAVMDGLYTAATLPVSRARSLVVLFSDGEDNLSWLGGEQVRKVAERSNALIHVVGIVPPSRSSVVHAVPGHYGSPSGTPEAPHNRALRQIAEASGGRFWTAESPDRLRQTFAAIAEAMSHRYVLRYDPGTARRPGWHRLELKLRGKPGRIEARRGYWVPGLARQEPTPSRQERNR
jgi:VWFA-related protein